MIDEECMRIKTLLKSDDHEIMLVINLITYMHINPTLQKPASPLKTYFHYIHEIYKANMSTSFSDLLPTPSNQQMVSPKHK